MSTRSSELRTLRGAALALTSASLTIAAQAATTVAARVALLEGPACGAGGDLYFSDIFASRIYPMTTPSEHGSLIFLGWKITK